MRRRGGERGQAIVEAAVFLPIVALLLFGVIFFDRLGLVSERAQSAVRYGDMVAYRNGQAYSVAAVQDVINQAIFHNTPDQLLDLCLEPGSAASPTAGNVNAAIQAALLQSQNVPNASVPSTVPTPKAFWRPDTISSPVCAPGTVELSQSSPTGVGNLPLSLTNFSITAGVDIPAYLQPVIGAVGAGGVSQSGANIAFINVAAPSTLLACVPGLNVVLTIFNTAATGAIPCT